MQKNNKAVSYIEIIFYLAIIIIYPFLFIRYGVDYTDSAYHYMAYAGQRSVGVFTFLDPILGNIWMRITSNSYISYRILAKLLIILMHLIPLIFIKGINVPLNIKLRFVKTGVYLTIHFISSHDTHKTKTFVPPIRGSWRG